MSARATSALESPVADAALRMAPRNSSNDAARRRQLLERRQPNPLLRRAPRVEDRRGQDVERPLREIERVDRLPIGAAQEREDVDVRAPDAGGAEGVRRGVPRELSSEVERDRRRAGLL